MSWKLMMLSLLLWVPVDEVPADGDLSKRRIEKPIEKAIGHETSTFDVRTGIAWHANFDKALEASRHSNKPTLLFQLLGDLDEEFC